MYVIEGGELRDEDQERPERGRERDAQDGASAPRAVLVGGG